ncbi:unnamed protein product [Calypogeia fissa]
MRGACLSCKSQSKGYFGGWSDELVNALWDVVHDLRKSLQAIGSDLVIKFGTTQNVLSAIAREVEALDIIIEEEVELEWHHLVRSVSVSFSEEADEGKDPSIKQWQSSIYDIDHSPNLSPKVNLDSQ